MKKQYTAKECAEFVKKVVHIFDAHETYVYLSTKPGKESSIGLLKVIEEYKRDVPENIREYLDNSDELSGSFETINKLEKEIKEDLKLWKK